MQSTSQKFKDNIYAPDRKTKARVIFDISDQTANGDVSSITTTSESPLSVKAQLINKVRNSSYKTATLEQDRFKLDGSFSFADDTLVNNGELGWSSAVIGDSAGSFAINNILVTTIAQSQFIGWTSYMSAVTTLTQSQSDPLGSNGATRIQTTGGTSTVKYYLGTGAGVVGTVNTTSVWIKNNSIVDMRVTNNGGSNILIKSTDGWVKFSYQSTSNGSFSRQLAFISLNVGDSLDFVAFQPQITETSYEQPFTVGTSVLPALSFNFTSNHSSAGLTITFDEVMGEYATEFDMTAYDASNTVIATTVVTGNTQVIATPLGQLLNYRKVSVIIRKWSKPNRRARVMEVDFGIVKQYTDDNLIGMNLIEQMDMLSGQLPSAEFRFSVDNSDRAFNILNPGGFYKYLQQKQQVIGEIGLDIGNGVIEYVQVGNYLLQEWQSDEGSLTASFVARTNLDSMASFDYENLSASTKSLYQLAVDTFTLCGISNYSIDSALSSINTNSLLNKANCRDILQMIAIAGCANIFVTRGNIITLKCNPSLIGPPVDTADFDNMYNEPQIALDKAVKRVEVTYWTDLSTSAIVGINSTTDTLGDTLKLENNTLINNSTRATAVANWFFAQLKYRATYKVNWRGNPATELNDVISLENSYGGNMSAYVTRNELNYSGALRSRLEAKGMVN